MEPIHHRPLSTREVVADMTRNDYTPREISRLLDLSTQMVYRHIKALGMKPATKAPSVMPRRVR